MADFTEFCLQSQNISFPPVGEASDSISLPAIYVGLGSSGKLHLASDDSTHVLAANVTSFAVASGFVIFTTTAHQANFVPLAGLGALLDDNEGSRQPGQTSWETRRVERGSRIVVAIPSAMSLVLQMPRGNLETINPRPLVLEIVKQDIDQWVYPSFFQNRC